MDGRIVLGHSHAGSSRPAVLEVTFDPATDRLSIRAVHAGLSDILQEVAKKTRVTIEWRVDPRLSQPVSADIEGLPLERGLRLLLRDFNSAFVYSSGSDTASGPVASRLAGVLLLSGRGLPWPAMPSTGDSSPAGHPGLRPDLAAELARALFRNDSRAATRLVEALKAPGQDAERQKAVEALLLGLDDRDAPGYYGTLSALKELDPARAVESLARRAGESDAGLRVTALTALGYLGHAGGIDSLTFALDTADPAVRLVSASGLARIGGPRASGILFEAYLRGGEGMRQAVGAAIAWHGDATSQERLARLITGGSIPAGASPRDVIVGSLSRDEAQVGN